MVGLFAVRGVVGGIEFSDYINGSKAPMLAHQLTDRMDSFDVFVYLCEDQGGTHNTWISDHGGSLWHSR